MRTCLVDLKPGSVKDTCSIVSVRPVGLLSHRHPHPLINLFIWGVFNLKPLTVRTCITRRNCSTKGTNDEACRVNPFLVSNVVVNAASSSFVFIHDSRPTTTRKVRDRLATASEHCQSKDCIDSMRLGIWELVPYVIRSMCLEDKYDKNGRLLSLFKTCKTHRFFMT